MSFININFLFFDYVILILSLIIILFSVWKGFINSVLGLLTWVGSLFITIYSYTYLSSYINNLLLNIDFLKNLEQFVSILSTLLAIPLIFLLSLFILKRVRKILSSDLDKQILGLILDKFFGLIYGIVFSYVIFSTVIYFTYNNKFNLINSLNIFLVENSNILNQISMYNDNIINIYNNEDSEINYMD